VDMFIEDEDNINRIVKLLIVWPWKEKK
jgi:hypothetical protein